MSAMLPLGRVIAQWSYRFDWRDGGHVAITVRIGRPVAHAKHSDGWACPYEIDGPRGSKVRAMIGVDPLQALLLTLGVLRTELDRIAHAEGGTFDFEGGAGLQLPGQPT